MRSLEYHPFAVFQVSLITNRLFCFFHSNRKFAEYFTEDLNKNTADEIKNKALELGSNLWSPLHSMGKIETAKCVQAFEQKVNSGLGVFSALSEMIYYNGHPIDEAGFKPNITEQIKMLDELMNEIHSGTDDQTFAFGYESGFEVYFFKSVLLPKEFKFLKEGLNAGPGMKSMLTFDQIMPFNNKNHNDEPCVSVEELPLFYKRNGN